MFDLDAVRFADFAADFNRLFGLDGGPSRHGSSSTSRSSSATSKPGQVDSPEVQQIKALIRRGESRAAGRECGVPVENLHFLDMPFYETGKVRKKPLGEEDIRIVAELLEKIRPHQIYAAGDLSDPHGTHRVCLAAIFQAVRARERRRRGSTTAKSGSTAGPGRNGSRSGSRWPCR